MEEKRWSGKIASIAIRVLLFLFAGYVALQLFAVLDQGYETETAIQYSMTDSIECSGLLSFDEVAVEGSGLMGYLVGNGERVSAGTAVAELYTDSNQAQSREALDQIKNKIALLEKSESAAGDVNLLLTQTQSSFADMLEDMDRAQWGNLQTSSNHYLLYANKFQYITGRVSDFSDLMARLNREKDQVQAQLGNPETLYAVTSGYFVDASHTKFNTVDRDYLDSCTAGQLADTLNAGAAQERDDVAGKVVTSYEWSFYGICSQEQSAKFENVSQVELSFPGYSDKTVQARVEEVTVDEESGLAKLKLTCEYMNSDIPQLSQQTARIDFASYEGIRIPASALHIVDGEKGVYVKYGNIVYFRKISILYQNEDFILVPENGSTNASSENQVRLYDEIITRGNGLRNEKLL